jgi:hypothetical protein
MDKSQFKVSMKKDRIYEVEIDSGIVLILVVNEEDMHVQESRLIMGDGVVLEMLPAAIPFLQIVTDIIKQILEESDKE